MTAQLVQAAVALILALIGGSVAWQQVKDHGADEERTKEAMRRAEVAEAKSKADAVAPAKRREARAVLLARLKRLRSSKREG